MSEAAVGTATGENGSAAGNEAVQQGQETGAQAQGQETGTKGAQAQEVQEPAKETREQRMARYKALVGPGGEFNDLYQAETRRAVQGRLAEARKTMDAQRPVLEMLAARYGTGDMAELQEALNKDAAWWRAFADERGCSEEQARQQLTMQVELDAMKRRTAQAEGERRAAAQMEAWGRQAQEVQELYPEFDLQEAMGSEDFKSMLRAGVPMKTAYEVVHMDDIKVAVAQAAARDAETRLTANIQAKGARPAEGGASGQVGASAKVDPSKLSGKEIMDLAARAAKGENISF